MLKTMATVLVASVLWTPLAAHGAVTGESTDGSITISVEIPARTGAPTPPPTTTPTATPSPTTTPTPAASPSPTASPVPGSQGEKPRAGALPATGGEIALWGAAFALLALVAGFAIRARRRRSV